VRGEVRGGERREVRGEKRGEGGGEREEDWRGEGPGRLPWWRVGRPPKSNEGEQIEIDKSRPRIGMDGLGTAKVRPRISLDEFLEHGAQAAGVSLSDLRSRKRDAATVEARETLAWIGVELYGYTVKEVAAGLEKYIETASRLVSRAATRRMEDERFGKHVEQVDALIAGGGET